MLSAGSSNSAAETREWGVALSQQLSPNTVVCLFGDLGAGKTTFIQGLVAGVTGVSPDLVNSPTFVYLNIYEGRRSVYHFDLYRLKDAEEFLSMGFDDFFYAGGICCVEWAERIMPLLPEDCITVHLNHIDEQKRHIEIKRV